MCDEENMGSCGKGRRMSSQNNETADYEVTCSPPVIEKASRKREISEERREQRGAA
jgi:hypothetical protein